MATIRERVRSDGTTAFQVRVFDKSTRARLCRVFESQVEAERFIELVSLTKGDVEASSRTMAAQRRKSPLVQEVLSEHVDLLIGAAEDTKTKYRNQIRDHFAGALGTLAVESVDAKAVKLWLLELQGKGLAAKTIKNLHGLLSAGMKTAMQLGYRQSNPCVGIALPKSTRVDEAMMFLSKEEFWAIHDNMTPSYRLLLRFLVLTGLRWGEATALTVADFNRDSKGASVRVNKAWKSNGEGEYYVGVPKTSRSRRTVSLPTTLVVDLAAHVSELAPDMLLFRNGNGDRVKHGNFHKKHWTKAVTKAFGRKDEKGRIVVARRPRIHDLRHTHASWMLNEGLDITVLQRRLGHESITTTIDRYTHLLPEQHIQAASAADRLLAR